VVASGGQQAAFAQKQQQVSRQALLCSRQCGRSGRLSCWNGFSAFKMAVLGSFHFSESQTLTKKPSQGNTVEFSLNVLGLLGQELVLP